MQNKENKTYVLGLTGSIATGKSTVSAYFKEKGFPVVDADLVARQVVEPGQIGNDAIRKEFGDHYFFPNGVLDRKALGSLIFKDELAREKLSLILSGPIREEILRQRDQAIKDGEKMVVLDIPLLYEAGYQDDCDEVMVVYVPETIQLSRLMSRDQISREEAWEKMSSQWGIEGKQELADIVIDNSGSKASTLWQVEAWLEMNGFMD